MTFISENYKFDNRPPSPSVNGEIFWGDGSLKTIHWPWDKQNNYLLASKWAHLPFKVCKSEASSLNVAQTPHIEFWVVLALPSVLQHTVPAFGGMPLSTHAHHMLSYAVNLGEGRNHRDLFLLPHPLGSQEKMMVEWQGDCPTLPSAEVTTEMKSGAFSHESIETGQVETNLITSYLEYSSWEEGAALT